MVNDPQGSTVRGALQSLGFAQVREVRVGKHIAVELTAASEDAARAAVDAMCRQLLANSVIEEYRLAVRPAAAQSAGTP